MSKDSLHRPKWVTDKFLAERYEVSRGTIWRWTRAGRLPTPHKHTNGCTRWDLDEVVESENKKKFA